MLTAIKNPYTIAERENHTELVLEATGESVGCYDTMPDAQAYLGALEANEDEAKATWSETDHPRDEDGQFGSGGGGNGSSGDDTSNESDKPTDKPDKKPKPKPKPKPDNPEISDTPPSWATQQDRIGGVDDDGYYDYGFLGSPGQVPASQRARELSVSQTANLDDTETSSVRTYTTSEGYRNINGALRGQGQMTDETRASVAALDSAVSRNTLPEKTILYRGVHGDVVNQLKPGATFTDNAFTSTSFDQRRAWKFAGTGAVMRIRANEGQRGLALEAVSTLGEEKEFLLPRNTRYRIGGVSRSPSTGRHYVDVEIINE